MLSTHATPLLNARTAATLLYVAPGPRRIYARSILDLHCTTLAAASSGPHCLYPVIAGGRSDGVGDPPAGNGPPLRKIPRLPCFPPSPHTDTTIAPTQLTISCSLARLLRLHTENFRWKDKRPSPAFQSHSLTPPAASPSTATLSHCTIVLPEVDAPPLPPAVPPTSHQYRSVAPTVLPLTPAAAGVSADPRCR